MIGYWQHRVVRQSVRLSVMLCIVALRDRSETDPSVSVNVYVYHTDGCPR